MYIPVFIIFLLDNNTSPLQLRLTGGSNKQEGTLEILYYGVWGHLCPWSLSFSLTSANVACRRLGFPGAKSVQSRPHSSAAPVWLRDVQCFGNETGLEQCSHLGFGNSGDCESGSVVGVMCIGMHVHIHVNNSCHRNFRPTKNCPRIKNFCPRTKTSKKFPCPKTKTS